MLTYEETARRMAQSAAVVKLICGVANNAAWMVVLDAHDHAKKCRGYRHGVKHLFKQSIEGLKDYERRLLYAEENRMFHLADMSEKVRKKYGDISDREYYDFWASMGGAAYGRTRPLLTSLWNKYRLSLLREGVPEAEHVAWVMVGMAALELAVAMYGRAIDECVNGYQLPRRMVEHVFGQFSLAHVSALWRKALLALCPGTESIKPTPLDERNIEMGLEQLTEAWINPSLLYSSTMDTVEEFGEIFRTKGEQRKSMREIAEVEAETMRELQS
jgi:hypothetical protein